jgi:hypothetical protein
MFIAPGHWVPYAELIGEELRLLPSLYSWNGKAKVPMHIIQPHRRCCGKITKRLGGSHNIDLRGALSSLPQAFNGIFMVIGLYLDTVTEWLGKQQEHLQELRLVRVVLTIGLED